MDNNMILGKEKSRAQFHISGFLALSCLFSDKYLSRRLEVVTLHG
jgi:hypothetical protein